MVMNYKARTEEDIERQILRRTPIGTSMHDVLVMLKNHNEWWELQDVYKLEEEDIEDRKLPKDRTITACLNSSLYLYIIDGSYICADWKFDDNSKLINVTVRKDVDSI